MIGDAAADRINSMGGLFERPERDEPSSNGVSRSDRRPYLRGIV